MTSQHKDLQRLITLSTQQAHLSGVASLLNWDQETYMPQGSIQSRADQSALIAKLKHQLHTGGEFKNALKSCVDLKSGELMLYNLNDQEKRLLSESYKDWRCASVLPNEFIEEFSKATTQGQHAWAKARGDADYSIFKPYLETIIDLTKKKCDYLRPLYQPNTPNYDILLDEFEPGASINEIEPLFKTLKEKLKPIIKTLSQKESPSLPERQFPIEKQWQLSNILLKDIGFDTNYGRLDKSTHPFTTEFHPEDVRLTTRFKKNDLLENISSTLHEGGHALYEQNLPKEWFGTPLCRAASLGVHESQSRFWEIQVGSHRQFLEAYWPTLNDLFKEELSGIELETYYAHITKVEPSLIRVQSDPVTYNLHIIIRMECEKALIEGTLSLDDLPEYWNEAYKDSLGITPNNDAQGVLQDVHWSFGAFGYFPTYTIGNLYAAQLWERLEEEQMNPGQLIKNKDFYTLLNWLKTEIHAKGNMLPPKDLMESLTNKPLESTALISSFSQ